MQYYNVMEEYFVQQTDTNYLTKKFYVIRALRMLFESDWNSFRAFILDKKYQASLINFNKDIIL